MTNVPDQSKPGSKIQQLQLLKGQPNTLVTTLRAEPHVRYELVDAATGKRPQSIKARRVGDNLEIAMDEGAQEMGSTEQPKAQVVLQGYFSQPEVQLVAGSGDSAVSYPIAAEVTSSTFTQVGSFENAAALVSAAAPVISPLSTALLGGGGLALGLASGGGRSTPNQEPVISSSDKALVSENASAKTVVYTAKAVDPEGKALTYSLGGTDALMFTIDASTGEVRLRESANYEAKSSYTITVFASDGALLASKAVTVNVSDVNEWAQISGTSAASLKEDGDRSVSGQLLVTDPDAGHAKFQVPSSLQGQYGTFTFEANTGVWSYKPDHTKIQFLAENAVVTDTLAVNSFDGTASQDIVVTLTGVNDPAAIAGTASGRVTEDSKSMGTSGKLTVTDTDANEGHFLAPDAASLTGQYGRFTFNAESGEWSYLLDNSKIQFLGANTEVTDRLEVRSLDNTAKQDIVVTLTGINDKATITGSATASVTEDGSTLHTAGKLAVDDVDAKESLFQELDPASLVGQYGRFTFNASSGEWTYAVESSSKLQPLGAGDTFDEKITVKSLDGTASQEIVVTLIGVNDPAAISGTVRGSLNEDGDRTVAGQITVTDADAGQARFQTPTSLVKNFGAFNFTADTGKWSYLVDNSKIQFLGEGKSVTDTLTVSTADGTTQDIVVTLTGINDQATIAGTATGSVTEDGAKLSASGKLTVEDADANESRFQLPANASLEGQYGRFTLNADNGEWSYAANNSKLQALNAGATVSDKLEVKSWDGTATQHIAVTLTGVNDQATISGIADGSLSEDGDRTVTGKLTVADADAGEAKFLAPASLTGNFGTFSFSTDTGQWSYLVDNSKIQFLTSTTTVTDKLEVMSFDGTAKQDIVVTLTGTNDQATISGTATGSVTEDSPTLSASGTLVVDDPDANESKFLTPDAASLEGHYGRFTFDAQSGKWTYLVDNSSIQFLGANTTVTDELTVRSLDNTVSRTIVVTIHGVDEATQNLAMFLNDQLMFTDLGSTEPDPSAANPNDSQAAPSSPAQDGLGLSINSPAYANDVLMNTQHTVTQPDLWV